MTSNAGQGASCAIESAAALANHLHMFLGSSSSYSLPHLRACLSAWQSRRQPPARALCNQAYDVPRLEAMTTLKNIFIVQYLLSHMTEFLIDESAKGFIGAEKIDFLPLPERSLTCQIPYDEKYQNLKNEKAWKRRLWAMSLFICLLGACKAFDTTFIQLAPFLEQIMSEGAWSTSAGETLKIQPLYEFALLDKILGPITVCFMPSLTGSDQIARLHMISFLADCGLLYGIWVLESYRKTHGSGHVFLYVPNLLLTLMQDTDISSTTVLGVIAQIMSIAKTAPVYCLIDYLQSPLSNILVGERGNVRTSAAKALLPSFILGYYLLLWASFLVPDLALKQRINALWQLFPVLILLLHRAFMLIGSKCADGSKVRSRDDNKQSVFYVRLTILTLAAISGISFLYVRFSVPESSSLTEMFIPKLSDYSSPVESFSLGIARLLRYDEIFSLGTGILWILLSLRDLQLYGIPIPWVKVVGLLLSTTWFLGPGTAFGLGWLWREELLADNRMRLLENRG